MTQFILAHGKKLIPSSSAINTKDGKHSLSLASATTSYTTHNLKTWMQLSYNNIGDVVNQPSGANMCVREGRGYK